MKVSKTIVVQHRDHPLILPDWRMSREGKFVVTKDGVLCLGNIDRHCLLLPGVDLVDPRLRDPRQRDEYINAVTNQHRSTVLTAGNYRSFGVSRWMSMGFEIRTPPDDAELKGDIERLVLQAIAANPQLLDD